jgi:DNA polymerase
VILFLDSETYSEVPINNGTYAYASCPKIEVMIESWAIDDGPVHVSDLTAGEPGPLDLFDVDDFEWIVIHGGNGPTFDRIVMKVAGRADIPPEKIWDTAVQARSHGLPGGLDKLCGIFNVPEALAKHKDGKKLIQLFCKPRPKNIKLRRATRTSHPVEWQRFLSYAGGDIHAMRYLFKTLPRWNYPTREHGLWVLDQKINERGFLVDVELAEAAIAMMADEKQITDAQTKAATEGRISSTTQRDKLLKELCIEHGVTLPDLTGDTIERRLEDENLPGPVKELLRQRLLTSSTSTAKYSKILKAKSDDDRMRGSLLFCGAPRTKRWSGKIFQPQNLPRPDMDQDQIAREIEWLLAGQLDRIMEPIRLSWNALRGLIIAEKGKKIVQADLAQIEARVLPWLAREEWKLDAFTKYDMGLGPDLYYVGAARLLSIIRNETVSPEEIDKALRQAYGKVPDLACGYGGASGAFAQFAALYRVDMAPDEVATAVRTWREGHRAIADWDTGFWKQLDDAARLAIQHRGEWFDAGRYIRFKRINEWLVMRLPSGGFLSYAHPRIVPDPRKGRFEGRDTISFMGIDAYTKRWTQLYTYGGKLSADATQATAREILAYNLPHVEEKYPIILQVHDEVVTETPDDPEWNVDDLVARLTRRPPWIDDKLPLAAGGFEAYRYRKDD